MDSLPSMAVRVKFSTKTLEIKKNKIRKRRPQKLYLRGAVIIFLLASLWLLGIGRTVEKNARKPSELWCVAITALNTDHSAPIKRSLRN